MTEASISTSVLYDHCRRVYDEMVAQARHEGEDGLIYEGFITKLFSSLELPTPYFTLIRRYLVPMGCMEQLRRGGAGTPSRWRLLREPSEEAFNSFDNLNKASKGKFAMMEQQLRDQALLIAELRREVDAIKRWQRVQRRIDEPAAV